MDESTTALDGWTVKTSVVPVTGAVASFFLQLSVASARTEARTARRRESAVRGRSENFTVGMARDNIASPGVGGSNS
jgi:hypothetical protein